VIRDEDRGPLKEYLTQRNMRALRLCAIIGYTIVPAFWLLDLTVFPESAGSLGLVRGAMAAISLCAHALMHWRREWIERWLNPFSMVLAGTVAWTVEAMVFFYGGYSSPYYAGVILVVIAICYLYAWPLRLTFTFLLLMYVPYLAPGFFFPELWDPLVDSLTHHVFLLTTMALAAVSQAFSYNLEVEAFIGRAERDRAKEGLESAYEQLQTADRLKSEFFSNITHELRTPLTMILSPLEATMNSDVSAAVRPTLLLIWRNGIKLLRLVDTLLDLSRIEENFLRLRVEQDDSVQLLRELVDHTAPLAARKDIDVTLEVKERCSDLYIDVDKLERSVINLLSNALKFTPEGGRVAIVLSATEKDALIEVQDSGIGIDPEAQDRIFERFQQADGSTTRRYGGTGIGLSFAREIVRLHGGDIEVESIPGEGSTFRILLRRGNEHFESSKLDRRRRDQTRPVGQRREDQEPAEWAKQIEGGNAYKFLEIEEATDRRLVERSDDTLKATRVLVVEDNVELIRFVHSLLEPEHAVYLASDGEKGWELAQREKPDLIVTDYMMPVLDGLGLIERVRAHESLSSIPIVMLTAKSDVEARVKGREAGADVYMGKPFDAHELQAAVRALLKQRGRQVSQMVKAQSRSLELISAGLAHEIHNPLSYVKNAHFVIARDARRLLDAAKLLPEEARTELHRSFSRIEQMVIVADGGINRLQAIVELVRRYARDGYDSDGEPLSVDELILDTVRLAIPTPSRAETLRLNLDTEGTAILGRRDELQQVIRNLVQNALDAVGEDGHVTVRSRVDDARVVVIVTDDGPGIPPDQLTHIFTPFYSTKDGGEGLGLGLAIAQQVTLAHGGTLDVRSQLGTGTEFTLRLPSASPEDELALV
jgi:signal transduction histidine kinase